MNLLTLTIIILVILLTITLDKNGFTHSLPLHIFNITWATVTLLSALLPPHFYEVSDTIWGFIIIIILVFNSSFYVFSITPKLSSRNLKMHRNKNYKLSDKRLLFLQIFNLIILIYFFPRVFEYIIMGEFWHMRFMLYDATVGTSGSLFKNAYEGYLFQWFTRGSIFGLLIVTFVSYAFFKGSFYMLLLSIINNLFYALITGGRWPIFQIIIVALIILILERKNEKLRYNFSLSKKFKSLVYIIVAALSLLAIYFSLFRAQWGIEGTAFSSFILETSKYFAGSLIFSSILIENLDFQVTPLFGTTLIAGLLDPLFVVLKVLDFNVQSPADIVLQYSSSMTFIGNEEWYNALTTLIFPFYLDGGIFFITANMILIAFIIARLHKMYILKPSLYFTCIYVLALYCLALSTIHWEPLFTRFWIALLTLRFIFYRAKNKITD